MCCNLDRQEPFSISYTTHHAPLLFLSTDLTAMTTQLLLYLTLAFYMRTGVI